FRLLVPLKPDISPTSFNSTPVLGQRSADKAVVSTCGMGPHGSDDGPFFNLHSVTSPRNPVPLSATAGGHLSSLPSSAATA
ncbi:unnamed protein product, partial [Urochloa humidicola]